MRICDLGQEPGARRLIPDLHILLRREGWRVNHKRVHRLYRERGAELRLERPLGTRLRGAPCAIQVDANGPEFVSKGGSTAGPTRTVSRWTSRALAKPTDNVMVESFNGRLRESA